MLEPGFLSLYIGITVSKHTFNNFAQRLIIRIIKCAT